MEEKQREQRKEINNCYGSSFSLRRIPIISKTSASEIIEDESIDKIKIIELSNIIDEWEQEVLFSDNGFFSLKGKDIENKLNEFIKELENFISEKISEISFVEPSSRETVQKIKSDKIAAIKNEMTKYEQEQINNWQAEVYENAISSSISRAVLYKSNPNIVMSSLKNGLSVLQVMSEKENWDNKTYKNKTEQFKSEFYSSLINSFIQDKDVGAYLYFNKYKDLLFIEEKEKLEKSVKELKLNIIAYNWSKELFSYKLSKDEQDSEIKNIKDKDLEKYVRKYLSDFTQSEKKDKERKDKEKNILNWQEIEKIANEDIDRAFLYIDYQADDSNIKHKKDYLIKIKKDGYIKTDKKQFIDLLVEYFENFEQFKNKDISDYKACFSAEDYLLFENYQKKENKEFNQLYFDYKYINKKLKDYEITKTDDKYDFVKMYIFAQDEYKTTNKKAADLENRSKIVDLILARFTQAKEKGDNNDSIINNTGK